MKPTGSQLLLTCQCNYTCDHCFVWGSPSQKGSVTLAQVRDICRQALELSTVQAIFLEGGEPFLYYPITIRAAQEAAAPGFSEAGLSSDYWATSVEAATEWLRPLAGILRSITVSTDLLNYDEAMTLNACNALRAAEQLDLPARTLICEVPERVPGYQIAVG